EARVADIQRDHLVALTFELLGTASQLPSDLVTDAFEMGTGLQRTDRHGRSSARKRRVFCPESTTPESGRLSGSSGRSPSSRGNARIPRSQEIPMPTEPRKLLVCVKRVADYDAPVRVRADGSAVVTEGVRTSL